jgi:hypothetical protein
MHAPTKGGLKNGSTGRALNNREDETRAFLRTEHLGRIYVELVGYDSGDGGKKKPQHIYVSIEESIRADEEDRWTCTMNSRKKERSTTNIRSRLGSTRLRLRVPEARKHQ